MKIPLVRGPMFRSVRNRSAAFLHALVLSLAGDLDVEAGTFTWDGNGSNNNWTSNGNWAGLGGAGPNDDLIFPQNANRKSNTNDFNPNTNFNSVTITGRDYDISGNQIFLGSFLTANLTNTSGNNPIFAPNIVLGSSQTWNCSPAGASIVLNGFIDLNGKILTFANSGNYVLSKSINGSGKIVKEGTGTLNLAGNNSVYTGLTQINAGIAGVFNNKSLGASGPGNGTVVANGATLTLHNNVTNLPEAVSLNGDGGGRGALQSSNCPTGCSFSGPVTLASNSEVQLAANDNLTLSGAVFGSGNLVKTGLGTLILPTTNTYSGLTQINEGVVIVSKADALGAHGSSAGTTVSSGASLQLSANVTIPETVSLTGNGGGIGALSAFACTTGCSITGPVTLVNGAAVGVSSTNQITLGGTVGGSGALVKTGTGTLILSAANTYTGATQVNEGTLAVRSSTALGASGAANSTVVPAGATLQLANNVTNVPESISLNGIGFGGAGALESLGGCNTSCSIAGPINLGNNAVVTVASGDKVTLNGPVSGAAGVSLIKAGPGTLVLGGNNASLGSSVIVNAGTLLVNANFGSSPIALVNGTLGGNGTVASIGGGKSSAAVGTVSPGGSIGVLTVNGNATFGAATTFRPELNGAGAGIGYDQLHVVGAVTLGGSTLNLLLTFVPNGDSFVIIRNDGGDAINGTFKNLPEGSQFQVNGRTFNITYHGGDGNDVVVHHLVAPSPTPTATASSTPTATPKATATATPKATATSTPKATATASPSATATPTATPKATPTATPVTTLANISTRLRVETGDNVLIGGFIITGNQPKKVIVRGIGTSLSLSDKLANPTLELHGPFGLIEANDNWVDSPNKQAIIDTGVAPTSNLEAAIVATLPVNSAGYTAIVRGANNTTGIGVVEAFDLDVNANSKLANISTRGLVQTGDNVLIAGTIIVGQAPQKVLVRGIGPSLSVAGKLQDPTLELRNSNGTLLKANDNWVDSPDKQAIIATTVAPTNNLESAIIATLPSNTSSYTAILRGVNNTTGIAVVEIFALE